MNTNVFDYLERLPPEALDKLYGKDARASSHGQWACRALLQSLPQLAKQHVMRLLFVEGFVDKGMLKSWVKKEYQRVHGVSVRKVSIVYPPFLSGVAGLRVSCGVGWQNAIALGVKVVS